jgi:putative lipoic acid-binding regulatory protein
MTINTDKYEKEAARLAELSRAERFEELIDFPARHLFKVIGRRTGFAAQVRRALDALGFGDVIPVERHSAGGRFVSLTFEVQVSSGEHLDSVYLALEQLPDLAYLL